MADILKGISGGWSFLVSWIFPSAIAWAVFGLFAFPHLEGVPILGDVAATPSSNQALVLAGVSLLTGMLLSGCSTVLYRVLEGYILLPERMAGRMRRRQIGLRHQLEQKLAGLLAERKAVRDRATNEEPEPASLMGLYVRIGLVREKLRRYPVDPRQFGPTRFANAMRAIETYGWDRYKLDSQTLWSELQSSIPDSLRSEQETARAPVNFFVSLVYLSVGEAILSLSVAVSRSGAPGTLYLITALCILAVPMWYRLAVQNTRYLLAVVQATVNVGRVSMAAKMGLILPEKLDDERDMWERVYWFVHEPFTPEYSTDLNSYRLNKAEKEADA